MLQCYFFLRSETACDDQTCVERLVFPEFFHYFQSLSPHSKEAMSGVTISQTGTILLLRTGHDLSDSGLEKQSHKSLIE